MTEPYRPMLMQSGWHVVVPADLLEEVIAIAESGCSLAYDRAFSAECDKEIEEDRERIKRLSKYLEVTRK